MRIVIGFGLWAVAVIGAAQSSGVAIELQSVEAANRSVIPVVEAARKSGQLPTDAVVKGWIAKPTPMSSSLPTPSVTPLKPSEVLARARKAMVRIGWHYLCKNCDNWHTSLAGGYAIAPDLIATCEHVIKPPDALREGVLVCVGHDGKLVPLLGVVGVHARLDAAVLRIGGSGLTPLPLQPDGAPGDSAFLYSDPINVRGYFSTGIINRYFWQGDRPGNLTTLEGIASLRINLSTDWAPGSSGAPLLDTFGNVYGHVTTISPVSQGQHPMFWTHEAVPARGILRMLGR